ncbi:hypothetical protein ASPTUDRAFT_53202 [Aspergillus tubingensis CBS 134.48]|uniref:Uncharacterized protein n=1 Tax=Aspergillus tubingensis (strain CBS 134.48) TaxID=767770 RepID=A0A1L9NQW2_ASPTC|nr:hypothetical protein ASPTUDRAFT_53202 [Aspergillus tubingensis CBS 134.48]
MQALRLSRNCHNIYNSPGNFTGWWSSTRPIIAVSRRKEAIRNHFCFALRLASRTHCFGSGENSDTAEPGRDHNQTNPAIFHATTASPLALACQMKPLSHHPESAEATAKARRIPQTRGRCPDP